MAEANQNTKTQEESPKVVPMKPVEQPIEQPAKEAAQTPVAKKKPAAKPAAKKVVTKKAVKKTAAKKTAKTQKRKPAAAKAKTKVTANTNTKTTKIASNDMETIMTQSKQQFEQFTKGAADFNRDGVEAFVKSGQIFAKGFEEILKQSVAVAQASAEKQAKFVQQAMSVKTANEFSEVQSKIAQANFDDFMSGATKLTELSTKVLTEAIEPINSQVTKSVQKASA